MFAGEQKRYDWLPRVAIAAKFSRRYEIASEFLFPRGLSTNYYLKSLDAVAALRSPMVNANSVRFNPWYSRAPRLFRDALTSRA
jgi:hypothetical protein